MKAEGNMPFLNPIRTILRRSFRDLADWITESRFRRTDFLAVVVYGAVIGFGAFYHEPWGDEALPWLIARDSTWPDFFKIIFENWDRHPGLFHLALIPFAKLGFPYFTQECLNLLLAVAAAALFVWKAPFPRIFRYCFLFTFYMLYEYSVITRPYMLAILLLFCAAAFYPRRNEKPVAYALLISLMLHADYMCFGLGAGLTVAFWFENLAAIKQDRRFLAAAFMMAANVLLVFWMGHSIPAGHYEYGVKTAASLQNAAMSVAHSFFPFYDLGLYPVLSRVVALLAGYAVLIGTFAALFGKRIPVVVLTVSLGYLFMVFLFLHKGDYRHYGFILLSAIVALWIGQFHSPEVPPAFLKWEETVLSLCRRARGVVLSILCALFIFGLRDVYFVYLQEYYLPFSGAKQMAMAIRDIDSKAGIFKQGVVVVAKHNRSAGLLPYLPGVKFWNPCTKSFAPYYLSTKAISACRDLPPHTAVDIAKQQFGGLGKILFLFEEPLTPPMDQDYYYRQLFSADRGIFGYNFEKFYLYWAIPRDRVRAYYEEMQKRQVGPKPQPKTS